jgi:hypothetical protein
VRRRYHRLFGTHTALLGRLILIMLLLGLEEKRFSRLLMSYEFGYAARIADAWLLMSSTSSNGASTMTSVPSASS